MKKQILATAAALVTALACTSAQAQQPPAPTPSPDGTYHAPPPAPRYITREKPILGLLIAGPIVLGVTYVSTIGITAGISAATNSSRTGTNVGYTLIPIVGPLVLLADPDRDTEDYAGALVGSTILQAGGLTMTILGAVLTTEERVPVATLTDDGSVTLGIQPGVAHSDAEGATLNLTF